MFRPAHLVIAGALTDLALTMQITTTDVLDLPHLSDGAWFLLDAVALALIGLGLWQSGRACRPFGAGWAVFAAAHVIISIHHDLAEPLLAGGDILVAVTGTVSAILNARTSGWNTKSKLLLAGALSVLIIPAGVAIGGDIGFDIALPLYSLILLAMGLGLTRESQRVPTPMHA